MPVFSVLDVLGVPQEDTSVDQARRQDQSPSREADVQEVQTLLIKMWLMNLMQGKTSTTATVY